MKQFDERDTMFVRANLIEGTKSYNAYYKEHPELKDGDDHLRQVMAQTMSKKMGKDPHTMQKMMKVMQVASKIPFMNMDHLTPDGMPAYQTGDKERDKARNAISGILIKNTKKLSATAEKTKVNRRQLAIDPVKATAQIKALATYFGADLVGIVKLKKEHLYSHKGTMFLGGDHGKAIELQHQYAIVVASALDKDLINRAPHPEQVIGTMKGYAKSCDICSNLVLYLKELGYDSRGDHFMEYLSPTTPLAIDAGIGELGRCNMCVSKEFGSRMKLGAVLTNIPLIPDEKVDFGLEAFCKLCGLCSKNCPVKAISTADSPALLDGVKVWPHKETRCMEMWAKAGTDCGICMSSCPFSQGVDPSLITNMKDRPEIMTQILQEHLEKYGNRNALKDTLPLVSLS